MISVLVEVETGVVHLREAVQAENIQTAVNLAEARCPGSEIRVVHPIDPERFFIRGASVASRLSRTEMLERTVG